MNYEYSDITINSSSLIRHIMKVCHIQTIMCRQKDKRTYPNLCHYVLMSKRTDEHTRTFMYGQKNITNLMSLWTYVKKDR